MPEPRHLRRAPITEALFDFRITPTIELTAEHLTALRTRLADRYPDIKDRRELQSTVRIAEGKLTASEPIPVGGSAGLIAKSTDGRTIAQLRENGFTFNRLQPYTDWDALFPEALRLWSHYCDIVQPPEVSRMAVRYINHLELPLRSGEQYDVYLLMPPSLPEPIPQSVFAFSMRFRAHDPQTQIYANITQQLPLTAPTSPPKLLLDIDAFSLVNWPARDETNIAATFTALRVMKNRVFFNLVTEQCLQLFQ